MRTAIYTEVLHLHPYGAIFTLKVILWMLEYEVQLKIYKGRKYTRKE